MRPLLIAILGIACVLGSLPAFAMDHGHGLDLNSSIILSLMELPFLGVATGYSFRTARALKGGIFGRGMSLMAWGLLVMAIGHLLMISDTYFGVNVLTATLGIFIGNVVWVAALILSWALMGVGLNSIYVASRG